MLTHRRISALVLSTIQIGTLCTLLASCSEGALFSGANSGAPGDAAPVSAEIRDAAVFQETENALWDGRPSLGGVWIAHPDAPLTYETAEIRNEATGKSIQAALFHRERDFPGPLFQLSSDAAVALRINAGTPTSVTVTALRREPVAPPPPVVVVDDQAAAETVVAEDSALVAADAAVDEALASEEIPAAEEFAEPATSGSAGSALFGAKPQNTGLNAPVAETPPVEDLALSPTAEDQAALDALDGHITPIETETTPEPKAGSAGSGFGNKPTLVDDSGEPIPQEGSSLQPITATEILAVPLPQQAAETADVSLESAAVAEPAALGNLERPFVQVASGSNKANVDALAAKLLTAGLNAAVRETSQDGAPLYYVVVGPAQSQAELDANLARVRGLGYPDAFIAKG